MSDKISQIFLDDGPDQFDPIKLSEVIASHKAQLANKGIAVRYSDNFEELESLLPLDHKTQLTPHFATALNTYTSANAFWLGGFDEAGGLLALNAARLADLGRGNQLEYLRRYWRRCYPGTIGDNAVPAVRQPRFWREITGRVAYYGDFHLKRVGVQGRGLPKIFAPLCVLLSAQKWDPDWHYTWIRPGDWAKRYPMAYGFARCHYPGLRWEDPPSSIDDHLVAAVNSRANLLDWVDGLHETYESTWSN